MDHVDSVSAIVWFALAGGLVIAEVFSLTFYMVALALGAVAGGVLAYMGHPLIDQLVAALLLATVAVVVIGLNRRPNASASVELDDPDHGQAVSIVCVSPLMVHYRGADWQATWLHHAPPACQQGDLAHIYAKHGNQLIIH